MSDRDDENVLDALATEEESLREEINDARHDYEFAKQEAKRHYEEELKRLATEYKSKSQELLNSYKATKAKRRKLMKASAKCSECGTTDEEKLRECATCDTFLCSECLEKKSKIVIPKLVSAKKAWRDAQSPTDLKRILTAFKRRTGHSGPFRAALRDQAYDEAYAEVKSAYEAHEKAVRERIAKLEAEKGDWVERCGVLSDDGCEKMICTDCGKTTCGGCNSHFCEDCAENLDECDQCDDGEFYCGKDDSGGCLKRHKLDFCSSGPGCETITYDGCASQFCEARTSNLDECDQCDDADIKLTTADCGKMICTECDDATCDGCKSRFCEVCTENLDECDQCDDGEFYCGKDDSGGCLLRHKLDFCSSGPGWY